MAPEIIRAMVSLYFFTGSFVLPSSLIDTMQTFVFCELYFGWKDGQGKDLKHSVRFGPVIHSDIAKSTMYLYH